MRGIWLQSSVDNIYHKKCEMDVKLYKVENRPSSAFRPIRPRLKAEVPHICIHECGCINDHWRIRHAVTGIKSCRVLVRLDRKVHVGDGRYQQAGNSCLCQSLYGKTRVRNLRPLVILREFVRNWHRNWKKIC